MTVSDIFEGRDRKTSAIAIVPAVVIALLVVGLLPDLIARVMRDTRLDQTLNLAWQSGIVTLVLFGCLIAAAFIWGLVSKRSVVPAGRMPLMMAGIGFAMGLFGLLITTGDAALAGSVHWTLSYAKPQILLLALGTLLTFYQSAAEELFFRGWIQPVLVRGWGPWVGLLVTSVMFAGLHVFAGITAPLSLLNVFLAGLMFGLLAYRTDGLVAPVLAHFAWNWAEGILLGLYPNPGVDVWTAVWNLDMVGSPLWGGSAEGLNASLGESFVLVALCVPLAWPLFRRPAVAQAEAA